MQQSELRKMFDTVWLEAIENSGAVGKFKKALCVFADKDVDDLLKSLEGMPAEICAQWCEFLPTWCENEVVRIFNELIALDDQFPKPAWEKKKAARRRQAGLRRKSLQQEIVAYVSCTGGAVPYSPASIAKALSRSRKSLSPKRVKNAMHYMCRSGAAEKTSAGKGAPQFKLLVALKADSLNASLGL